MVLPSSASSTDTLLPTVHEESRHLTSFGSTKSPAKGSDAKFLVLQFFYTTSCRTARLYYIYRVVIMHHAPPCCFSLLLSGETDAEIRDSLLLLLVWRISESWSFKTQKLKQSQVAHFIFKSLYYCVTMIGWHK